MGIELSADLAVKRTTPSLLGLVLGKHDSYICDIIYSYSLIFQNTSIHYMRMPRLIFFDHACLYFA